MPMKLIETTISETAVRMRYADESNSDDASEWLEFAVPLAEMTMGDETTPFGDPALKRFALIHRAALQHARNAIDAEIQRLVEQLSRTL